MGLYRRENEKGKTYWYSIVMDGVRIQKSTGTVNKKLAHTIYAKELLALKEGKYFDNVFARTKNFSEMMKEYFVKIRGVNKSSTAERKEDANHHLLRVFSEKMLDKISSDDIDDYKQMRRDEKAADATIINEINLMSNAFNVVGWRKYNPVKDAKRIKLKARTVERWLRFEEELQLLPKCEDKLHGDLADMVVLNLHTGLSQEEILSLRWSQIDIFGKALQTVRSKTLRARTIPLNNFAMTLLKGRAKVKNISGYVFFNSVGNKHDASKLKKAFAKAVKEAGVIDFTWHCLRHTYATRLLHAGMDIYSVSKLLGHKDIATTAKHYGHHCTESLKPCVEALEKLCYDFATSVEKEDKDGVRANA